METSFLRIGVFVVWGLQLLAEHPLLAGPCDGLVIRVKSQNIRPADVSTQSGQTYWGQALKIFAAPGFRNLMWEVDGPAIHDFDERVSNLTTDGQGWNAPAISGPIPKDEFRLYFVPTQAGQTTTRQIRLRAQPVGSETRCEQHADLSIQSYESPAKLYTADHQHPDEEAWGNWEKGRVVATHYPWHFFHHFSDFELNSHRSFLHWHHLYVDRYKTWRALFRYPDLVPWRGKGDPKPPMSELYLPLVTLNIDALPDWPATHPPPSFKKLEETILTFHDQVHRRLQNCQAGTFGCFSGLSSPKNELFWRFHLALDQKYTAYCPTPQAHSDCPDTGAK